MRLLIPAVLLSSFNLPGYAFREPKVVVATREDGIPSRLKPRIDSKRGNCWDGQILDPDVDQDKDTLWPVCLTEKVLPCPLGQVATHATRTLDSMCLPQTNTTKRDGTDPGTFAYRKAVKVGTGVINVGVEYKVEVQGRSTPAYRKTVVQSKFKEEFNHVADLQKTLKEHDKAVKEMKKKNKIKQRIRRGACLALLALTAIPVEDSNALDDDTIAGMTEPADEDPVPNQDLEDYMVTLANKVFVQIESETAGWGSIFSSLAKLIANVSKQGKVFGSISKVFNKAGGKSPGIRIRDLKSKLNKNGAASDKAISAAKASQVAQKILKSKTFLTCIGMAAVVGAVEGGKTAAGKRDEPQLVWDKVDAGEYTMTVNFSAPKTDNHPSPEDTPDDAILLIADKDTDTQISEPSMQIQTWPDNYNRDVGKRVLYESCYTFGSLNNQITMIQVWGGCCRFYDGDHCEKDTVLFTRANFQDGELRGSHNDAISSYWCTYDLNCKGAP